MALEYPELLGILAEEVEKPQVLEVPLSPPDPGGPNILCIYTGYTLGSFKGKSKGWTRGKLRFPYHPPVVPSWTGGRKWTNNASRGPGWTLFMGGTAMMALASVYNAGTAVNAGWAVDAAWLHILPQSVTSDEYLQIRGLVAVGDTDGCLYRLSYQATVLGRTL